MTETSPVNDEVGLGLREKILLKIQIKNAFIREIIAEFLGVFILVILGNGSVAQSVLSKTKNGDFISINLAYGMGVTMAVYMTGKTSGAHINPAMSIAFAAFGRMPLWKLPLYILAQVFGGFMSGAAVYSVYFEAINDFDGGVRQVLGPTGTGGIFSTYPQPFLSISSGVWDQVFGTAILASMVFAITDRRNNKIADGLAPLMIGLLVFAIGASYGYNSGYAINPARDFGPRLFTAAAGWGSAVFTEPDGKAWWWVPIVAPVIGGLLGATCYTLLIGNNLPTEVTLTVSTTKKHSDQLPMTQESVERGEQGDRTE